MEAKYSDQVASENTPDIERQALSKSLLGNTTVQNFAWRDVTVTVKDRVTKQPKAILENVSGIVNAGEVFCVIASFSFSRQIR